MKAVKSMLILVILFSNKSFSQEHYLTQGAQVLKFESTGKTYYNSKIFNEINIFTIDNNFIKINCSDPLNRDTVYTIIEKRGVVKTTEDKSMLYICKDIDGIGCYIYISTEADKNKDKTIEIQYLNSSIVYYMVK